MGSSYSFMKYSTFKEKNVSTWVTSINPNNKEEVIKGLGFETILAGMNVQRCDTEQKMHVHSKM